MMMTMPSWSKERSTTTIVGFFLLGRKVDEKQASRE
jgi:hypothetical protein